jgi:hypothetical protein
MEETIRYTVTVNHGEYAEGIYENFQDAANAWYAKELEKDPRYLNFIVKELTVAANGKAPSPEELYEELDSGFQIMEVYI